MKLKSTNHQTSQENPNSNSSNSTASHLSTSSSVPIFAFKNDANASDESNLVSILGGTIGGGGSRLADSVESGTNKNGSNSSFSTSPTASSLSSSETASTGSSSGSGAKKRSDSTSTMIHMMKTKRRPKNLGTYDSNEEDSPESSGDEYVHTGFVDEDNKLVETANASKKLLGFVTKIAASNYFQKATENKYIKMAMENVSNCQLLLNVEVRKITGTLALNIPPHPSDRLWLDEYGFLPNPQLVIVATPQVGEKEVSHSAITEWIADKLKLEFQKVLVFPNMDDFCIPILKSEVNT